LFGLIFLVVSLPLSKFTLSVSQFVLVGNWIVEGKFKEKFLAIKHNVPLLIFELFFLFHVLGLFYTSNFTYAFLSLKLKLPLLLIPIIISSTSKLTRYEFKLVIRFFIAAVFASALIGTLGYYNILKLNVNSNRDISIFIPHISLAILVNLALFFSLFQIRKEKILFLLGQLFIVVCLFIFVFILKSITGIITLFLMIYFLLFKYLVNIKKGKVPLLIIIVTIPIFTLIYSATIVEKYFNSDPPNIEKLEKRTVNNHSYYHNINSKLQENGNYVYIYVCEKELRQEWNKRSNINYDSLDLAGNPIKHTLIRFLASKNQKKDSIGINNLAPEEIDLIEKGYSNYLYAEKFGVKSKIADVSWQISLYKESGDFKWNSVIQRFIAYKIGINAFKENWLFGYGTGDIEDAFIKIYQESFGEYKKHAFSIGVNQLLSFLVSFGVFGTFILLITIFYPPYILKKYHDYYFYIFIIIAIIAMFSEEMLKFQSGSTIFAFFYSLLLFGRKETIDGKQG
jgi:O-antigen ligase/polysaccharide polymerase Wzy-like membrane protein